MVRAGAEVTASARLAFYVLRFNGRSIAGDTKKEGPAPPGSDPQVIVRLSPTMIEAIDARAAKAGITRSEQVRRLLEQALAKTKR